MQFEEQLHELIAKRAMELSLQRNNGYGSPKEDWMQAEREIRHELSDRSYEIFKEFDVTDSEELDIQYL